MDEGEALAVALAVVPLERQWQTADSGQGRIARVDDDAVKSREGA